jgi:hypothetical protein
LSFLIHHNRFYFFYPSFVEKLVLEVGGCVLSAIEKLRELKINRSEKLFNTGNYVTM